LAEPRLELKTVAVREDGCFSVLLWDGRPFAVSVERTFENGRPVITQNEYKCTRSMYIKGGYEAFEIHVPGHTRILFHKGNVEEDSVGCVIVAGSFGVVRGRTAVLDARTGFGGLMELTAGLAEFYMVVTGR
jgi:hypothetical protein